MTEDGREREREREREKERDVCYLFILGLAKQLRQCMIVAL